MFGPHFPTESYHAVPTGYAHFSRSLTVRTQLSRYTTGTRSLTFLAGCPHAVDVPRASPVTDVARSLDVSAAVAITGTAHLITISGGLAGVTRSHSFVLELDEKGLLWFYENKFWSFSPILADVRGERFE